VCAVSYLNTVPLVWGFLHDPRLRHIFDVKFELPSICADQMAAGAADIGILPAIEMARQKLDYFPGVGISSDGPVRSILLISKTPYEQIKTLATDSGSRTSVMLSRVILKERFGVEPAVISHKPDLTAMLQFADAALLIGDAALRVDPPSLPYRTLDLGGEWTQMTGLPMVFAVWSGRKEVLHEPYGEAFIESCKYGLEHMDEIAASQAAGRGFPETLIRKYLTEHIIFEFSDRHYAGLETYLRKAAKLEPTLDPDYLFSETVPSSKGGVPA
jgi:chorismate dehydratase